MYGKVEQPFKSRVVFLKLGHPSMRSPGIGNTVGLYSCTCKLQRCYCSSFQLFSAFFCIPLITKAKCGLYRKSDMGIIWSLGFAILLFEK